MSARAKPFILLTLLTLLASAALAQVSQRTFAVHFSSGVADVSYSAADFADARVRRSLASGPMQTLVLRTYAYEAGSTTPFAMAARICRVHYDDWPQNYVVEEQTTSGSHSLVLATIDQVLEHCLVAQHEPVGTAATWSAYHGHRITFGVVVELNPLTPDRVQRIRQWLARPGGGASDDDAFFGSFVSLFVNRGIGDAERTMTFRSQDITCP